MAVIGAGYWGPNWVRVILDNPNIELRAVCDLSPSRRAFIRERYPAVTVTGSIEEVLADNYIDAVILVTPVSTHETLGLSILEAGKHLLIEKPLAGTVEGAQRLVDLADQSGLILAVGHIFAYHSAVRAMKREISNRSIGDVLYFQSQRMNLGPPDPRLNVVWDLAVHDLSIMFELCDSEPIAIQAVGGKYTHGDMTDVAFITVRFADGKLSSHQVGWHTSKKVREFFVAGDLGSIRFDDTLDESKLTSYDLGIDNRVESSSASSDLTYGLGQARNITLGQTEPLQRQCYEFIRAIRRGSPPIADGRSGVVVVRVMEFIDQSIEDDGRVIAVL